MLCGHWIDIFAYFCLIYADTLSYQVVLALFALRINGILNLKENSAVVYLVN